MLKKEILDSLKIFILCLLLLLGVPLGFALDRIIIHFGWNFSDLFNFMFLMTTIAFPITAGLAIFQSEKKNRAFEYLFSLPLSRFKILMCKVLPRLMLLLVLIIASALFSVYANYWLNGFNLVILFLISVVMSISFSSLWLGAVGIAFFFYGYYTTSRILYPIFTGWDPEKYILTSASTELFHSMLAAVLLLIPLGTAFWLTFKKLDVKPLKLQMKSFYSIVLPTLLIFIVFIILSFRKYLDSMQ
jgi:hypothetical protein